MKTITNPIQNLNSKISHSKALEMIEEYKSDHGNDQDFLASEYFDVEAIRNLIANPKCRGLRIYNYSGRTNGKKQNRLLIMAEDEKGKTIVNFRTCLSSVSVTSLGMSMCFLAAPPDGVAETGTPCPPICIGDRPPL